jgi:hypothetical protein
MKHYNKYNFDPTSVGSNLQRLSNLILWSGIALIGMLCAGMPLNMASGINGHTLLSVLLTAGGAVGFGCLVCSVLLWRTVFGIFPNVFATRGRDARQ